MCAATPQWGGQLCNTSQCVGGTPRESPSVGCDCNAISSGTLCQNTMCVHGSPSSRLMGATCTCNPGYTGQFCDISMCDYGLTPIPANNSLNYTCNCGSVSTFNETSGGCNEAACVNGTAVSSSTTNRLSCTCAAGFTGALCDERLCPDGTRSFTYFNASGLLVSRGCKCDVLNDAVPGGIDYTCLPTECLMQLQELNVNLPDAIQASVLPDPYATYFQGSTIVKYSSSSGDGTDCGCSDSRYTPLYITGPPFMPNFVVFLGCWRRCASVVSYSAAVPVFNLPDQIAQIYGSNGFVTHLDPDNCDCPLANLDLYPMLMPGPACDGVVSSYPLIPPSMAVYDPVRNVLTYPDPVTNVSQPPLPVHAMTPINESPPNTSTMVDTTMVNLSMSNNTDDRPVPVTTGSSTVKVLGLTLTTVIAVGVGAFVTTTAGLGGLVYWLRLPAAQVVETASAATTS